MRKFLLFAVLFLLIVGCDAGGKEREVVKRKTITKGGPVAAMESGEEYCYRIISYDRKTGMMVHVSDEICETKP